MSDKGSVYEQLVQLQQQVNNMYQEIYESLDWDAISAARETLTTVSQAYRNLQIPDDMSAAMREYANTEQAISAMLDASGMRETFAAFADSSNKICDMFAGWEQKYDFSSALQSIAVSVPHISEETWEQLNDIASEYAFVTSKLRDFNIDFSDILQQTCHFVDNVAFDYDDFSTDEKIENVLQTIKDKEISIKSWAQAKKNTIFIIMLVIEISRILIMWLVLNKDINEMQEYLVDHFCDILMEGLLGFVNLLKDNENKQ